MRTKVSAADCAEIFGVSQRSVNRWIEEENWRGESEIEHGKPVKKYLVALLPKHRKQRFLEHETLQLTPASNHQALPMILGSDEVDILQLEEWRRDAYLARLTLYREFLHRKTLCGTTKAWQKMVTEAKAGLLPPHLQQLVPLANARNGSGNRSLSKAMILGWQRAVKKGGAKGLIPKGMKRQIEPPWAKQFIQLYNIPQKPSLKRAWEDLLEILPPEIAPPSYHAIRRFHNSRSRLDRERGRRSGSELKAFDAHRVRDTSELLPMQVGVCDGHSFKARVANPKSGNPFHPEVCTVIDAATRVVVGWMVGLAESAETVGGAVRHAATINDKKNYGGVFSILYTDCGSGNKAKVLSDELTGIFARIGTSHEVGIPGNPRGRGLIERLNSSLWIPAAKRLATYTGKDMDSLTARTVYLQVNREIKHEGRSELLPTWPQFIEHCRQEVDRYNRRPHSSLPRINDPETGRRRHMSPFEMWALHVSRGWKQEECQLSEKELELLFLPRQRCHVANGMVQLHTNTYFARELVHYHGEWVQVAYDIHNGEQVQVWDNAGRLICYAFFEKNKSSMFPRAYIEQKDAQRAKRRLQIKYDQIEQIEAERRGTIDTHPAKILDFTRSKEAIEAERAAIRAEKAKLKEQMENQPLQIPQDDKGRYRFWKDLDARMAKNETLVEKEVSFYEMYRKTVSFRAFQQVEEQLCQAHQ